MHAEANNQAHNLPGKRVLFLCYHGIGHINPIVPLAEILGHDGYQVTLATAAYFSGYVRHLGYAHYPLKSVPFGLGFENWVNRESRIPYAYWSILRDRYADRLYHERKSELAKVIEEARPDVICIDGTQATDFIVLFHLTQELGIKLLIYHAMFPTHVLPGRPPVNSFTLPGRIDEEKKALRVMRWKLWCTDLRQRLAYLGMSDRFLIWRRMRKNQLPSSYKTEVPSLFDFEVNNIPTLVLAPREYDFPDFITPPNHHYIGFLTHHERPSGNDQWIKARDFIRAQKVLGARVVYCSFGTVDPQQEKNTTAFLFRLAEVVTKQGNVLVVSMGGRKEIPVGLERNNVLVFQSVPQVDVLLECDVFVTHGGLSSIKEAINARVPMLVITIHHQFDPPGNSARVEYHGLGIRGKAVDDVRTLDSYLRKLMHDESFRANLEQFRKLNESYTPEKFLSLFRQILNTT